MIHLDKSEYWMGGAKFPNKTNGKFHLKATNFLWKKNFIYHRNSIHVFYATVFMNIYRYDCTHLMCIGIYIILNHECYPWDHGNMGCISEAYIIDSTCYKNLLDGTIKNKRKINSLLIYGYEYATTSSTFDSKGKVCNDKNLHLWGSNRTNSF